MCDRIRATLITGKMIGGSTGGASLISGHITRKAPKTKLRVLQTGY